jgi:hypothetical protein
MLPDANAVRPSSPVTPFPAERILWARTPRDEVAVVHGGQTIIYANPEALREAILDHSSKAAGLLADAEAALARAQALEARATEAFDVAEAKRRRAGLILRLVEAGVAIGSLAAIVATTLGLGR